MAVYDWPSGPAFAPASVNWSLRQNTIKSRSPLNGSTQVISLPGARWTVTLSFGGHRPEVRAELEAFLNKLSGGEHRVRMAHPTRTQPAQLRGSPVVNGPVAQFASLLNIDGTITAADGGTPRLLPGDFLQLPTSSGDQLVQVVNTTSGLNLTGVEIRPMLRGSVADNAVVTILPARAVFLLDDDQPNFDRLPGNACGPMTVSFIEAF